MYSVYVFRFKNPFFSCRLEDFLLQLFKCKNDKRSDPLVFQHMYVYIYIYIWTTCTSNMFNRYIIGLKEETISDQGKKHICF